MKSECSLPCSQHPCLQQYRSSQSPHNLSSRSILILLYLRLGLPNVLFLADILTIILCAIYVL